MLGGLVNTPIARQHIARTLSGVLDVRVPRYMDLLPGIYEKGQNPVGV